jgi:hypothetical protein
MIWPLLEWRPEVDKSQECNTIANMTTDFLEVIFACLQYEGIGIVQVGNVLSFKEVVNFNKESKLPTIRLSISSSVLSEVFMMQRLTT